MTERPQWTKAIQTFLADTVMDDESWPTDNSADALLEEIEEAVYKILCGFYGHEIEDDQCGLPEHRYCGWCGQYASTLGEA